MTVQIETGAGIATYAVGNLSMGGLYLHTPDEEFPLGSHLLFTLVKPGLKRGLQLGAVVAFARKAHGTFPRGVGLRFDELGASDRERLQQILQELGLDSPDAPDTDGPPIPDWGDAVSMFPSGQQSAPAPDYGREPPTEPNLKVPKKIVTSPSPAMSTLFDDFEPPPPEEGSEPVPFSSAHAGFRPPPKPTPITQPQGPGALPAPSSGAPDAAPDPSSGNMEPQERLMLQIRGLLLQLGETQERLAARENEIAALKEEVQRLTRELEEADPERARRR